MVDIAYAHMSSGSAFREGEIDYLEELAGKGAKVVVPTSSEVIPVDLRDPEAVGAPPAVRGRAPQAARNSKTDGNRLDLHLRALSPRGMFRPEGTYIASMETAAIIYFNSVLGARTNRCGYFVLYAALTGKYPKIGYLLDENRKGTHLVSVEAKLDGADGLRRRRLLCRLPGRQRCAGFRGDQPAATGGSDGARIGTGDLGHGCDVSHQRRHAGDSDHRNRICGSAMAPETIRVTSREIERGLRQVAYGQALPTSISSTWAVPSTRWSRCALPPDCSRGARFTRTRPCGSARTGWPSPWPNEWDTTKPSRRAGGVLVCDTCPMLSFLRSDALEKRGLTGPAFKTMLTDSPKQAKYANNTIGCEIIVDREAGTLRRGNGKWEGIAGWRARRFISSARAFCPGGRQGEALVLKDADRVSGRDRRRGQYRRARHPYVGDTVGNKIMIYPEAKGSSGGCMMLRLLAKRGTEARCHRQYPESGSQSGGRRHPGGCPHALLPGARPLRGHLHRVTWSKSTAPPAFW